MNNNTKAINLFKTVKDEYQDKKLNLKNPSLQKIMELGLFIGIDYGAGQCYCILLDRKQPYIVDHYIDSFRIDNRGTSSQEGLYILKRQSKINNNE